MDIYKYVMTAPEKSTLMLDEYQVEELRELVATLERENAQLGQMVQRLKSELASSRNDKHESDLAHYKIRESNARLKRENAELKACANIDAALGALEDDPDRQTPGQRTWHLYFDGLYNEMPY